MSPPRIVALEGTDGCGKTTHAHHLALALRKAGVSASAWEHRPAPAGLGTYNRALHYALERATLASVGIEALGSPEVLVVDRWWPSNEVTGSLSIGGDYHALRALVTAERWALPSAYVILLHAPQAEIERRLAARGEPTDGVAEQQRAYIELAEHHGWPAVATTLSREQVTERLVGIVRGWL